MNLASGARAGGLFTVLIDKKIHIERNIRVFPLRNISSLLVDCNARHSRIICATASRVTLAFCGGTSALQHHIVPECFSLDPDPTYQAVPVPNPTFWIVFRFNLGPPSS
jgi:hypothetical protein